MRSLFAPVFFSSSKESLKNRLLPKICIMTQNLRSLFLLAEKAVKDEEGEKLVLWYLFSAHLKTSYLTILNCPVLLDLSYTRTRAVFRHTSFNQSQSHLIALILSLGKKQ